jgi:hypothetical protein
MQNSHLIKYRTTVKNLQNKESEIIHLYLTNFSILELSKKFKTSETSIKTILIKNEVKLRNRKEARNLKEYNEKYKKGKCKFKNQKDVDDIILMYENGDSVFFIAKKYNVNSRTVKNVLLENNIAIRTLDVALSSKKVKDIRKNTMFEKYGVCNPQQVPDIYKKTCRSASRYKNAIIEGVLFDNLQGYEEKGIRYILKTFQDVNINEITSDENVIPKIPYIFENKKRLYYPDFYIKKLNLLIEIKSTYTFQFEKEKNLIKQQASKDNGYDHIILILNDKGELINEI